MKTSNNQDKPADKFLTVELLGEVSKLEENMLSSQNTKMVGESAGGRGKWAVAAGLVEGIPLPATRPQCAQDCGPWIF